MSAAGLAREPRARAAMEALPEPERRHLAEVLDEVMRPMTPREIELALLATGLSRSDRRRLVAALKGFELLMLVER